MTDRAALAVVVHHLGQLALDHRDILKLDVNPMLATEHGVVALDARIWIETPSHVIQAPTVTGNTSD